MQIIIEQETLKNALRGAIKTIARSPHLPILSGIFCQANSQTNQLALTTTNLLTGVKLTCAATVDTDGQFIVPGKFFFQIISSLESPTITLEITDQNLKITAGRDKINITLLNGDFPDFPILTGETTTFATSYLENIVTNVSFACSQDLSRPILTGIYLVFGEQQQAVGTDGFKLAVLTTLRQADWLVENLLLSASAFSDVLSLAQSYDAPEVKLVNDEAHAQVNFVTANFIYFAKVIDGNYPPFGKIMPQSFVTQVEFSKEEMQKNLSKALLFIKENSNIIKLEISQDQLLLLGQSSTGNNYEGVVNLEKFSGEPVSIAFNANYLLDFLSVATGESIFLGVNDKTKPALLRDLSRTDFEYVAMPFKAR